MTRCGFNPKRILKRYGVVPVLAFLVLLPPIEVAAHELRPAYLELREGEDGRFSVMWKTPMRGDMRLSLRPEFSGHTEVVTPVTSVRSNDAAVQKWRFEAVDPLRGQVVTIVGLSGTMTDALVRIEFADGTTWVKRLTATEPSAEVPATESALNVSAAYLGLGFEHILSGFDHLSFVLALLLISRGTKKLVLAITAFTVAHSITLSAAALGLVNVPAAPVEAVIALSIVFVAAEVLRLRRGHPSMTARSPWVVAFVFGLLHGLGFAGALSAVGMPQAHVVAALLFFNLGVEAGQLVFVLLIIAILVMIRRQRVPAPRWAEAVPPYAIGSLAMFWVIQRVLTF